MVTYEFVSPLVSTELATLFCEVLENSGFDPESIKDASITTSGLQTCAFVLERKISGRWVTLVSTSAFTCHMRVNLATLVGAHTPKDEPRAFVEAVGNKGEVFKAVTDGRAAFIDSTDGPAYKLTRAGMWVTRKASVTAALSTFGEDVCGRLLEALDNGIHPVRATRAAYRVRSVVGTSVEVSRSLAKCIYA